MYPFNNLPLIRNAEQNKTKSKETKRGNKAGHQSATKKLATLPLQGKIAGYWKYSGSIALFSDAIDAMCLQGITQVPESYIMNRVKRDGSHNKITLVSLSELKTVMGNLHLNQEIYARAMQIKQEQLQIQDAELVLQLVSEFVIDDFADLGLGRVCVANHEVYFKVLQWNSANAFLSNVGLAQKDFFITVGFKDVDIQNVKRDASTLLQNK